MWDNEHKLNQIHIEIFINKKTIITKCPNIMHGYRNTNIKHTPRTLHRALHAHQKVSIHIKYFLGRIKIKDQETLKKNLFDKFFSDRARCGEWGTWSSSGYKCSNGEYFRHVFFKKMHKW